MRQARDDRQQRIAQAIANGEEPKQRDMTTSPYTGTPRPQKRTTGPSPTGGSFRSATKARPCPAGSAVSPLRRAHQDLKFLDIRSTTRPGEELRHPNTAWPQALLPPIAVPEPVPIESVDIKPRRHPRHRPRHQEPPCRQLGSPRPQPTVRKTAYPRRKHQHDIAGKPRGSKRRHHAVAKAREQSSRYTQRRAQDLRRQIRDILLEAKPKMVSIESLHPISMMASARGTSAAPGKNVAAKRKLNESLAESAIGYVGKLLRRQTRHTHRLRPTAGHVPNLPALRRPAPEQPREPSGVPVPELRSQSPRRLDCCRHHSQPGLRPALRMAVRLYTGRTDRTHRVARAAIRLRATTTASRLGAKRVQAGRHRDEFPREQGPWPKAGHAVFKRRAKAPKVLRIVLVTEHTLGVTRNYPLKTPFPGSVLNLSTQMAGNSISGSLAGNSIGIPHSFHQGRGGGGNGGWKL